MNKQQINIVAIMLAIAVVVAGFVVSRDGADGHSRAAQEHKDEHAEGGRDARESGPELVGFTDAQVAAAGIAIATAGPAHMDTFIRMPGQIALNEDRTAHVTPRAAGAVESVPANLGEQVREGEVLAVIASAEVASQRAALGAAERRLSHARNLHATEKQLWDEQISARQDLQKAELELREAEIALRGARQQLQALGAGTGEVSNRLRIVAPFDGIIVEKHIALGETVGADTRVFTLTDLSTVWADVTVPAKDLDIVRVGTAAVIRSIASDVAAPGKVSYVSSLVGQESRSAQARVVLANPKLAWRPGLAVNVDIVTGSAKVPVAVARTALQTGAGRQVVYKRVDQGFVAQPVAVGRSDGRFVEITSGLRAGERYAAAGSFVVKAEQGKGEGGHHD